MSRMAEDLHPVLSTSVIMGLCNKSIYSCSSFITTTPELLAKITGLPYGKILEIKSFILTEFSSPMRFGHKYYRELIDQGANVPSGIENFDKLLNYGFMTGNIYELCGFAGCGKTQLCKTVSINICKTNQRVLYFDSKNDISARRFFQIAESKNILNVNEVLKKIHICQVRSACDLLQQLHRLESRIKNVKKSYPGLKLIVIDSLSVLFQYFHGHDEGQSILNSIASFLKYIAREYHIIILLTNFAKKWTEEIEREEEEEEELVHEFQQPAMSRYWASVPDVRIMMKKLEGSNECILVLLKSFNQPSGKSVKIRIADVGVI